MNSEGEQQALRAVSPKLYNYITEILEESNIHPYDIQTSTIKTDEGLQVFVQYGENFKQSQSSFFSFETINNLDSEINDFTKEIADACKEAMIADYFKMMKM